MPVKECQKDGKPGYKWGNEGYCYTYTPNNEESRERAKDKAKEQGRAIQVNKSSDIQSLIFSKDKFTKLSAIEWAKSHGFKTYTTRETKSTIRVRQFPPSNCLRSGGIKELDDGVKAYICITSVKVNSKLNKINYLLNRLLRCYK